MRDTRYPSLKCFRVSYGWIGKMKKANLKPSQRSIVKEVAEKQLLQWFKNCKRNPFSNFIQGHRRYKRRISDRGGAKITQNDQKNGTFWRLWQNEC